MGNQRSHLHVGVYMLVVIFLCLSLFDGQASALDPLSLLGGAPPQRVLNRLGDSDRSGPSKILQAIRLHSSFNSEDVTAASPDPAQYIAAFLSMVLFLFLLLKAACQMYVLIGYAAFACPDISILSRFLGGHAPPFMKRRDEVGTYAQG